MMRWGQQEDDKLALLFARGLRLREIGLMMGRSKGSVEGRAWRIGLDADERPEGYRRYSGRPPLSVEQREQRRLEKNKARQRQRYHSVCREFASG
jgi:hypothetical protein